MKANVRNGLTIRDLKDELFTTSRWKKFVYFAAIYSWDDVAGPPIEKVIKTEYNGKVVAALVYSLKRGGEDLTANDVQTALTWLGVPEHTEVVLLDKDNSTISYVKKVYSCLDMIFLY